MDLFDWLLNFGVITAGLVAYLLLRSSEQMSGNYRLPGWNYYLKLPCAYFFIKKWKRKRTLVAIDEFPRKNLFEGTDEILLQTASPDGATLVVGMRKICCRQPIAEVTVYLKLANGTEYFLPKHPEPVVGRWQDSVDGWRCGGLVIQVLERNLRLRILYDGELRNMSTGELEHVKFNMIWGIATRVFHFPQDWSDELAACALAYQPWHGDIWNKDLNTLTNTSTCQFGAVQGRVQTRDQSGNLTYNEYVRARGACARKISTRNPRREVTLTICTTDGTAVVLNALSYPDNFTECYSGYVRLPNFTSWPITSTDLIMSDFCESPLSIPEVYTLHLGTSEKQLKVILRINRDGGRVFSGIPYSQEIHYRTVHVEINGFIGTGVLQLAYQTDTQIPVQPTILQPTLRWLSESEVGSVSYCAAFDSKVAACPSIVGGKGASLALLASKQEEQGYKVPPGFCVTYLALEQHLESNPQIVAAIKLLEAATENYNETEFKQKCQKVVDLFIASEIESEIKNEVLSHLEGLEKTAIEQNYGPDVVFAIRSSAVGEDSEALSAAGQNSTVLGCNKHEVVDAIKHCWASMYAFHSVYYRRSNGQQCACRGSVTVQTLVRAAAAGVMFTIHETPSKLLIAANYGLGESVVSGSAEPDTIVVRRDDNSAVSIAHVTVGDKRLRVEPASSRDNVQVSSSGDNVTSSSKGDSVELSSTGDSVETSFKEDNASPSPSSNGDNVELSSSGDTISPSSSGVTTALVSDEARRVLCVAETDLLRLANIGVQQELLWDAPRDIEWGMLDGEIYLLQARPITSLERWSEEELLHEVDMPIMSDDELLTFANTGEVMPKPISALSYDLVTKPLGKGINVQVGTAKNQDPCDSCVLTHYRACLPLYNSVYKMVPNKINLGMRVTELGLHGRTVADEQILATALHRRKPKFLDKFTQLAVMKFLFTSKWWANDCVRSVKKFNPNIDSTDLSVLMENIVKVNESKAFAHLCACHAATTTASLISQIIAMAVLLEGKEDFTLEQCSEISTILSCGNVVSADVPQALSNICRILQASGRYEEFRVLPPEAAMDWLKANLPDVRREVDKFLEQHGHRAIMEFDLATKPWVLVPEQMMKVLQSMTLNSDEINKQKSVAEIVAALKTPKKSLTSKILTWVLPLCQRLVRQREQTKAHLILGVHKLRLALLALGKEMMKQWYLPEVDLIFHFRLHELNEFIKTRDPALLRRATQRRQYMPSWSALKYAELQYGWPKPEEQKSIEYAADASVRGTGVCGGEVVARACVLTDLADIGALQRGDVLITGSTDIGWSPYFPLLAGVVTELGGLISHGAVIAREYGLPCVVGAKDATNIFVTGDTIRLSATEGLIERVQVKE